MKKFPVFLSVLCLTVSLMISASAAAPLEYTISGPGDPEYGKPTSFEVVYTADGGAMKNEDVSKNAALAPPAFGSYSADALNKTRYVAIFEGTPLKPVEPEPDPNGQPSGPASFNWPLLLVPLGVIAAAGAGVGGALFLKRRKENEENAE